MSENDIHKALDSVGEEFKLSGEQFELLASQLLWRIGRSGEEGPVTVRLGLAASVSLFADLPRLRSVSDTELEAAIKDGELRVEWVGSLPG